MAFLDNSGDILLDAVLTDTGRFRMARGDFKITKFALGDDEIDYSLWDTTHTNGTDYYGAVIDNLPALEPFNDPSEIMKYKLVSRGSENFQPRAMIKSSDAPYISQDDRLIVNAITTNNGSTLTAETTFLVKQVQPDNVGMVTVLLEAQ